MITMALIGYEIIHASLLNSLYTVVFLIPTPRNL